MTEKAAQLISDFKLKKWGTERLYERLFELTESSNNTHEFLEKFLVNFTKSATIFNDALSYIEEKHFEDLINKALKILEKSENENAEAVIEYASLQCPELLHKHLETIFALRPNESAYYAEYPWRNLQESKIKIFKEKFVNSDTNIEDKRKLFFCLLETRNLNTLEFVFNYALENGLSDEAYLIDCLENVGFTKKENRIQSYCPNKLRHFSFPLDYLPKSEAIHLNKERHPTWRLKPDETKFKIGGIIENDSSNPFFHLITFEKFPDGLNITNMSKLVLGLHIREVNECGSIFYRHDERGEPKKIILGEENKVEFSEDNAIKESFVSFAETPKRWEFQSRGSSNSRENLFRLGGEPTWIQGAEILICPECQEKMDFLLQLDSELPDVENEVLMFGSGGICYAFWCDKDKISGYLMQCT